MKNGGQILLNAAAICEMYKTSCQQGEHLTNGVSENHLKSCSVQWLNFIRFLHETNQDSTNLARKFHQAYSSDMH